MKRFVSRLTIHCPKARGRALPSRFWRSCLSDGAPCRTKRGSGPRPCRSRRLPVDVADRGVESANVMDGARGTPGNPRQHPGGAKPRRGRVLALDKVLAGRPGDHVTVLIYDVASRCSTGRDAVGVSFSDRDYVQEAISTRTFAEPSPIARDRAIDDRHRHAGARRVPSELGDRGDFRSRPAGSHRRQGEDRRPGGVAFIMREGANREPSYRCRRTRGSPKTGVARGVGPDGVERLCYRALPYTSARLVIGMPVHEAPSAVVQRDWRTAAEIVSIALLIAGAVGFGETCCWCARCVRLPRRTRLGPGDLAARAVLPAYPANEFCAARKVDERHGGAHRQSRAIAGVGNATNLSASPSRTLLTKIANRRSFEQRLAETWEGWMDEGRQLAA